MMAEYQDMTPTRPIFVVGNLHTGTSLVSNILGLHPEIFMIPGETRFFSELPSIRHRFPDLNRPETRTALVVFIRNLVCTRDPVTLIFGGSDVPLDNKIEIDLTAEEIFDIVSSTSTTYSYGRVYRIVCDVLAKKSGALRWLDKSPDHVYHLQEIMAEIPDALVVETVRDPRDVLVSRIARDSVEWQMKRGPRDPNLRRWHHGGYHPFWDSLRWRGAVLSGSVASSDDPARLFRSRYEDLVFSPEPHIRSLCRFLELDFDRDMLAVEWRNSTSSKQSQQGIGSQATGKWRTSLPIEAIAICQAVNRSAMREMNYEPQRIPWRAAPRVAWLLFTSVPQFMQRIYRRFRLGGTKRIFGIGKIFKAFG